MLAYHGRNREGGGDLVGAVRRTLLHIILAAQFLGHNDPSPRLPGEPRRNGRSGRCPECGGVLRKAGDGDYGCLTCGQQYDHLPKTR
jgi:hypothetical protein